MEQIADKLRFDVVGGSLLLESKLKLYETISIMPSKGKVENFFTYSTVLYSVQMCES